MSTKKELTHFLDLTIEEIFADRFSNYSKYIIQDRALPDARDGLKPVQRRILYSMNKEGNTFKNQFRKSAKTVGNVIGNYHPHGDISVYDAMVRMSQSWKMRMPLVVMHGNNGSIDGDTAAAMRYTEAKLSEYANFLLQDIELETVSMTLNFDDTELEPTVLPTRIPNLLINGTSGISAGYATDIPPHNPEEILKAAKYVNEHPNATLDKIMEIIKGPDFPTGGTIQGLDQIKNAYETGKGRIIVCSKYEIKKHDIIITEIPYEVNKSVLLQKIEQHKINQRVQGIAEIIDQSDQNGLSILIRVKKEANPEVIMNFLLKNTDLQKSYNFNMIAIDKRHPRQMGLVAFLNSFLEHRDDVITKRSSFLLEKAEKRMHIVDGLKLAMLNLEEVIKIIRKSNNKADAKQNLMSAFPLDEVQAEAIVMMQLYRLTNTDISILIEEHERLTTEIMINKQLIEKKEIRTKLISTELSEVIKVIKEPRLTKIEAEIIEIAIDKADLIQEEEIFISISHNGYIKRSPTRSFVSSTSYPEYIEGDYLVAAKKISNKDQAIIYFDDGSVVNINGFDIPEGKWKDRGNHISQIVKVNDGVKILGMFVGNKENEEKLLISMTKNGIYSIFSVKEIMQSSVKRAIIAQKIKKDDEVVAVKLMNSLSDKIVAIASNDEYYIVPEEEKETGALRRVGRKAGRLKKNQTICAISIGEKMLLFTDKGGYFKLETSALNYNTTYKELFGNVKSAPHRVIQVINTEKTNYILVKSHEICYNIKDSKLKEHELRDKIKLIEKNIELKNVIVEPEL